jgi:protein gp37
MGQTTGIEWTHHTWSPWWGCTKVSDGCKNCYADTWSNRWGFNIWGPSAERRFFGDKHWNDPRRWDREAAAAGERRRVFPSMCDPFEGREDLYEPLMRFCGLIEQTPNLDWLLLTKRPENIDRLLPMHWMRPGMFPRNVWLGTSAEDQETFDARIAHLQRFPAPVIFLSCEPLLAQLELLLSMRRIDWVIVGGESGARARPMHPEWVRDIREQCSAEGVPFFFKQWGEWLPSTRGTHFVCTRGHFDLSTEDRLYKHQDGDLCLDDCVEINRVGKASAGRVLDGRTWDEIPEVRS